MHDPPQSGNYSLVARAVARAGEVLTSSAVLVFIQEPEEPAGQDPEAGKVYPAVLPAAPVSPGALAGGAGAEPPGGGGAPASPWSGSPGDWLNSLTNNTPPAAPTISASADGCNVKVSIHDLSENEEGFNLFRLATGSQGWSKIASLASSPGQGWLTFTDGGAAGGLTYYAAVFNSAGEAASGLAMANLDPQDCPQPAAPEELPALLLKMENLKIGAAAGEAYCYARVGSGPWERFPQAGFLTQAVTADSARLFLKPALLTNLAESGNKPAVEKMDLYLECWRWENGRLLYIGNSHGQFDLTNGGKLHAAFPGMTFDIEPDRLMDFHRELFKLETGISPWLKLYQNPYSIEHLGYLPESDQMPLIGAWITDDPEKCKLGVLYDPNKEKYCTPLPGFNNGPGGVNPQYYLMWSVINGSCMGTPAKECFKQDWWRSFAKLYPDPYNDQPTEFYVETLDYSGGLERIDMPVDIGIQTSRVDPNFPPVGGDNVCWNGHKLLRVYFVANTQFGTIIGPASNLVAPPCPTPVDKVKLEVTFNQFELGNIDDGLGGSHVDNVFGLLAADVNGAPAPYLMLGWWGGSEPGDYYGGNGYIYELGAGFYALADFQLCLYTGFMSCDPTESTPFSYNNNKLTVTLKDGDALLLRSEMYDTDDSSNPDAICNANVWVGPRTIEQWAGVVNEQANLIQDWGDATCNLQVILNALKPGQ